MVPALSRNSKARLIGTSGFQLRQEKRDILVGNALQQPRLPDTKFRLSHNRFKCSLSSYYMPGSGLRIRQSWCSLEAHDLKRQGDRNFLWLRKRKREQRNGREQVPHCSQGPEELGRIGLSRMIGDWGEELVHQPPPPQATLKPGPCPHHQLPQLQCTPR